MTFLRTPLSLAALISTMILAACASTATPAPVNSPVALADTSTPEPTAPAGSTLIPVTTETPFTIEPADLPSSYVGPLPEGAVVRLGQGLANEQTISPDGNVLAVGTSTSVLAFDISTLNLLWSARTLERVSAIAWSHDSAKLAAGLYDGATLVWETKSGQELLNLPSTNGAIDNLDWTPDGQYLISTASRGVATITDVSTGAVLHTLTYFEQSTVSSYGEPITLMWGVLSPDGHIYATHYEYGGTGGPRMGGETFVLWDIPSGKQTRVVDGNPQRLKWSPDSRFLASESSYSGTITIWDALTGQITADIPMDEPRFHVYWSPDGTKLFAGAPYSNPVVMDVIAQKILFDIDHDLYGYDFLDWSASGDQFTVYDGQSRVTTFDTHTGQVVESRSSGPDRYFLNTGTQGEQLGVWDVKAGAFTKTLLTGTDSILSLSWSPDGKHLGTTSRDEIAVWDVTSSQPETAWRVDFGRALLTFQASGFPAWSPDGHMLAFINQDKIELVDSRTGASKLQLAETADQIAWLPDGNRIVFGNWGSAFRLYDIASSQMAHELRPGGDPGTQSFASSPDGKQFMTVNPNGGLIRWNAVTGERLGSISLSGFNPKHEPLTAISPDLTMLATTNQYHEFPRQCDKALVRLTESDTVLYTIGENDLMADGCPYLAAWSPDSKTLAITYEASDYGPHVISYGMLFGETGGVIALYNGKTGHRFRVLRGHSSYINTLAFSPDGKYLASGSDDGTVIIWDMVGR